MLNKLKKNIYPLGAVLLIFLVDFLTPTRSLAQINKEAHKFQWEYLARVAKIGTYRDPTEYTSSTIIVGIVASVITIVLSLVGTIFIILIIYGGFLWLTARGNKESVEKATKIIRDSVIGAAIIIGAYVITHFITKALVYSIEDRPF